MHNVALLLQNPCNRNKIIIITSENHSPTDYNCLFLKSWLDFSKKNVSISWIMFLFMKGLLLKIKSAQ